MWLKSDAWSTRPWGVEQRRPLAGDGRTLHLASMRLASILLLCIFSYGLPAAVSSTGGSSSQVGQGEKRTKTKPAWVDDPTVGGTTRAVVLSWPAGADRDVQRSARAQAVERLRTAFTLSKQAKTKDMDMWTDESGTVFIHLVAR